MSPLCRLKKMNVPFMPAHCSEWLCTTAGEPPPETAARRLQNGRTEQIRVREDLLRLQSVIDCLALPLSTCCHFIRRQADAQQDAGISALVLHSLEVVEEETCDCRLRRNGGADIHRL